LDGHYVLIEGRFLATPPGQIKLYSGSISDITNIEPWPPKNLIIPPGDPRGRFRWWPGRP
jgi:hypothetical protein